MEYTTSQPINRDLGGQQRPPTSALPIEIAQIEKGNQGGPDALVVRLGGELIRLGNASVRIDGNILTAIGRGMRPGDPDQRWRVHGPAPPLTADATCAILIGYDSTEV